MGGQVEILEVAPERAPELWPALRPYVTDALARDVWNSISVEGVRQQLATGHSLALVAAVDGKVKSVTVCQLYRNAHAETVLHVLATAGEEMGEWLDDLVAKLQQLGYRYNCNAVTMSGRVGWAKRLRRYGWEVVAVDMRLDLDEFIEKQEQPAQLRSVGQQ